MGGGISVVAVETRFDTDANGRRCILETVTPLTPGATLTFGERSRGPGFITFGGLADPSSRMGGGPFLTDPSGMSSHIRGRNGGMPDELDRGGYGGATTGSRNPRGCHLWSVGGPRFVRSGDASLSVDANLANRAAGERIILLAEALFRMLDDMEGQLASQHQKGPLPAPTSIVDHLPTHKYSASPKAKGKSSEDEKGKLSKDEGEENECYICLSEYCEGEMIRTLPCKHAFHAPCVDKWLKEVHRVCPLCRASVCTTKETRDEGTKDEGRDTSPHASSSGLARRYY